ncbi:NAD(P)-dependent alcohol dehydrogenase [Novosphingobium sp. RL4]|uniref:NAD(P)-dependent alcohol dehydrogenase n=1 Tax=Novosphingobium sp. RL4 TaxID=3109595 RepID=UPI002D798232|nr:NAD(P)-dependent alcohol dehydrogenase [Novosphingobium sp. RL4]WRT94444.1 NAD(P)-dependent alcohol dehydrogenase [Novosphingobium sp. RL4]
MCTQPDTQHSLAALLRTHHGKFEFAECELEAPRDTEVLIRIVATGMCHTDLAVRDGVLPTPLPAVLGHEGAGVVLAVGDKVESVAPGDHVVLTFLPCASCPQCLRGAPAACERIGPLNFGGARADGSHALTRNGEPFSDRFFGQSSFATLALADARNVVKVRKDAPLELLGPLGCGIQTGAGTVLNALRVGPGNSFAVFGGGAVGLSALMAAKLAGATKTFVVDRVRARLDLARELGATHVLHPDDGDVAARLRELSDGGVEFSLDTTGHPAVIRTAVEVLRPTGTCAFVGASRPGTELTFDANDFMNNNKRLMGVIEGASNPQLFIPQLVDLYLQGSFPFDKLVRFYDFLKINQAAADSESGETIKPILRMTSKGSEGAQ